MTDPPDEIKQNGVKTIMYLRNSLRSSKAYYTVKLMLVGRAEQGKTTLMHRLMRDYTYNINQSTNGTWKCLVLPVQLLREWRVLSVYIHIYCWQVANTTPEGGSWVIPILGPRKGWPLAYHRGLRPVLFSNSVGLAEFPQFGKKCRIKFTLPRQMGRQKK